uniref:Uncharacterized protein n=1 Tax=Salix viminalis TaxID=40686 RepID=A0A6N2NHB0_SALVM
MGNLLDLGLHKGTDLEGVKGKLGGLEKNACEVLCRLRNEGDEAKENLKEVLSTNSTKQVDPDCGSTRESILQVLANLTSVQSCFDMFSKKIDQEAMVMERREGRERDGRREGKWERKH